MCKKLSKGLRGIKGMKKIILAVCQIGGGGAERVVSTWSAKLADRGYDVSILVFGRLENEYKLSPKVKVLSIVPLYDDFQNLSYIKRYFRFRKILKENKPDVLISFLPTAQIWCNFASIGLKFKRIETVRNNPWLDFSSNKLHRLFWKHCFNKADSIIVQTSEQIEFFKTKNRIKCKIIPNPVADEFLHFNEKKFNHKVSLFVASGRIMPQKNYQIMINAFSKSLEKHPDIKLKIFGKGNENYIKELKKLIDQKGINKSVEFCGYSNNLIREYQYADGFLMTSDYEGMPNSLIEALASKLICISTDCKTGPKDLIDHNINGFLAKTGDVDSIFDCIEAAIDLSPSQIVNMGNSARKKIVEFCSDEKSFKSLLEIIEKEN